MNRSVFGDIEVSKIEFYDHKKAIGLNEVDVGKIVVSNKVKGNNETSKIFIGYMDDTSVIPLCLLLPQMSGWMKNFENGGKNMSFKIEDESVYIKHVSIWNKIKALLSGIRLSSDVIYDDQYIKTKVKTFNEVIKTMFVGDKIPKEKVEYICIACISIDSVLKVNKTIFSTRLFGTVQI